MHMQIGNTFNFGIVNLKIVPALVYVDACGLRDTIALRRPFIHNEFIIDKDANIFICSHHKMILAAIKICTFAKTGRNPIVFNGQGG